MSFDAFLSELAKVLEFPKLAPDEDGACLIEMKEEEISLLFEFDDQLVPNTILLSSPILPFSIEYRMMICEACLKANSEIEEILSIKPDEDFLYLHRRLHPEIQVEDLKDVIASFLNIATLWRDKVKALMHQPPRHPRPTSSIDIFPNKA